MGAELIESLKNPSIYPHDVEKIELIETHISWIILTGPYAYKIKKPVDFGFLDFTTVDKRRLFCNSEISLNRRTAPDLYIELLAVTGSSLQPKLLPAKDADESDVIDYVIKMVQFPTECTFDAMEDRGLLTYQHIEEMAANVALFHDTVGIAGPQSFLGSIELVYAPMQQNFQQIRPMISDPQLRDQLDYIEAWTQSTFQRLIPELHKRKLEGFIRECHGDLHLGNITIFNDKVTLFDGIEFNDEFRWVDVISDVAFLLMDLEHRGLFDYANRFLNTYLEETGDYVGLLLLPFYKAYRAVVRAKISLFTMQTPHFSEEKKAQLQADYESYMNLAEKCAGLPNRVVITMHGLSGTGKSTVAQKLVDKLENTLRVRSDIERKRLHGLTATEISKKRTAIDIYTPAATQLTYERITFLCKVILDSGASVIVDATNLKQWQRKAIQDVADSRGVPVVILCCEAPISQIEKWIDKRAAAGADASEADMKVVEVQMRGIDALTEEEQKQRIVLNTQNVELTDEIVKEINAHLH